MTQPSLLDLPDSRTKKRGSVRRSSVLTYQAERGRIGKRAENVRGWLGAWGIEFCHRPTSAELSRWIFGENEEPVIDALYVRRGLSDCQTAGVVERVPHGDRKCRVSGRTCCTWRLKERG